MPALDPAHPLAIELASDRERYNALFEAARARYDALEGADVLAALGAAAPAVEGPEAGRIARALYPVVLGAVGRAQIGPRARQPEVAAAWTQALATCRAHVARDPARVASALLAALGTIGATPGAQPSRWARRLGRLAAGAETTDALLDAGAVLAWREGLARYRAAALGACGRLTRATALAALGVPDTSAHRDGLAMALDRLRADPWCRPEAAFQPDAPRRLAVQAVCGGFVGYGGPFLRPPALAATARGIVASDGEATVRLHADVFGTAFERVGPDDAIARGRGGPRIGRRGIVEWGGQRERFEALAGSERVARSPTTLAVGIPGSHRIALLALAA